MAVESTHDKERKNKVEWNFPCLGKASDGEVVLFEKAKSGTVVVAVLFQLGLYYNDWEMCEFTPLSPSESITLRNV